MAEPLMAGTGALLDRYCALYPNEMADEMEQMPEEEFSLALEHLPLAGQAAILERINAEAATVALLHIDEDRFRKVVPLMDPQFAAALLARWDRDLREQRLALLPARLAEELRELGGFPPDTAGSLMNASMMAFKRESSVENALHRIRTSKAKNVTQVFLVDEEKRLVGALSLQDLVVSDPEAQLRTLVRTAPLSVETMTPVSDVVELLDRHKLTSLPVVDVNRRLLGVIHHAGLVEAAKEEASADMLSMVGASPQERALSNVTFSARKRFPWLLINLATTFLAAAVVGLFEDTIAKFTALAVLLPVVAGQSGNAGAQALAVVMRGLALREIRISHGLRVVFKESGVGFINGVLTGLICAAGIYVWSGSFGLAIVIGSALVLSMVAAGLSGALIPVFLTALRQDPAQSSSIILTTVTDVVGFMSFLGLATLFSDLLKAG